ncbi:MAG: tetratricopeptide repeat protein [Burkholderiaceae bacterium]|nr:tetratricopeptide repeat protein [Burkholderiaceae bacterium]
MAKSLDLEEQEQLDQIKHFWKRYGNLITWGLTVVFAAIAAWNGWNYWQHQQAQSASVLFDEVERSVAAKDASRTERALTDLQNQYGRTAIAHQGALLAAQGLWESGDQAKAKAALEWAAGKDTDKGLQAIARLRLAGLAMDAGAPDEAAKWLAGPFDPAFEGLAADRLGDMHRMAGRIAEAKQAYLKAHTLLGAETDYRRLVEVKLNALGAQPPAAERSAL